MTRREDLARVDQALARLARMATGREGARLRAERSGVALSQPALAILAASRCAGAVRLSELSRLTGLEPALISREVRDLTATGHAQRRPDPSDGRAGMRPTASTPWYIEKPMSCSKMFFSETTNTGMSGSGRDRINGS